MERVTCEGGPLDGGVVEVVEGAPEIEVVTADDTRHRYVRREADRPVFVRRGRARH